MTTLTQKRSKLVKEYNKKLMEDKKVIEQLEDHKFSIHLKKGTQMVPSKDDPTIEIEEDITEEVVLFIIKKELLGFQSAQQEQLIVQMVNVLMNIYADIKSVKKGKE